MTNTDNLSKVIWLITAAIFFMPSWVFGFLADELSNENSSELRELSHLAGIKAFFRLLFMKAPVLIKITT